MCSVVYVVRSIKQYWLEQVIIFFGEQVIVFLMSRWSYFWCFLIPLTIFARKVFQIANSETMAELFAKNLINDGVHCSLFLQNILDGPGKSVAGERVTFCNSCYRLIGFWYSGNMCVLLFLLSESTY